MKKTSPCASGGRIPGVRSSGARVPGARTSGACTPGARTSGACTPGARTSGACTPGARISLAATLATMIAACLFVLSACAAPAQNAQNAAESAASCGGTEASAHTLYIGTTSQDGSGPVMPIEKAQTKVGELALEYGDGYTIYAAKGGWKDSETGQVYCEDTVVLVVVGMADDDVHALAKDAATMLDQKSVLIDHGKSNSEFYSAE